MVDQTCLKNRCCHRSLPDISDIFFRIALSFWITFLNQLCATKKFFVWTKLSFGKNGNNVIGISCNKRVHNHAPGNCRQFFSNHFFLFRKIKSCNAKNPCHLKNWNTEVFYSISGFNTIWEIVVESNTYIFRKVWKCHFLSNLGPIRAFYAKHTFSAKNGNHHVSGYLGTQLSATFQKKAMNRFREKSVANERTNERTGLNL